jgi:hypothetical protein
VVAEGSILADAALLATGAAAPGLTAEFRLVASRRAEFETVRVSAASLLSAPSSSDSSFDSSPTSVAATAVSSTAVSSGGSGSSAGSASSGGSGSSSGFVDDQETVRTGSDGAHLPPPAVDPWPDAAPDPWVPDPEQTVATEAPWRQEPTIRPTSPAHPGATRPRGTARPASAAQKSSSAPPQSGSAQPRSGSAQPRSAQSRSGAQSRPARQSGRREPTPTTPWATQPPAGRPAGRRRRSGFVRFIQVLVSILVLIAVPLAAMVLAYSYGTGEPLQEAANNLADDLIELFRNRI